MKSKKISYKDQIKNHNLKEMLEEMDDFIQKPHRTKKKNRGADDDT